MILKYLIILLILYLLFKYAGLQEDTANILLTIVVVMCIYEVFIMREGMENVPQCNYSLNKFIEQEKNPGYFLLNNGKFSHDIDYNKAGELICNSKFKDLLDQANLNIPQSPHTHIGKERGYLSPERIY